MIVVSPVTVPGWTRDPESDYTLPASDVRTQTGVAGGIDSAMVAW